MAGTEFNLDDAIRYARAFSDSTGIGCTVLDRMGHVRFPDMERYPCQSCRLVAGEKPDPAQNSQSHWQSVEQAMRFGGRNIFMCVNAFTHWTSPIVAAGRAVGALVAGPVLTIDEGDFFQHREGLKDLFDSVPRIEPSRVTALSQVLYGLARTVSDDTGRALDELGSDLDRQSRMNEYIQQLKRRQLDDESPALAAYPLEKERELLDQIRVGNIKSAQQTLNQLLGHVFFEAGSDLASIRYRIRELVALLSRAVMNEGADPEEVFGLNFRFVDAIDRQTDINGIAFWVARIARRFADLVLYMPNVQHGTVMRKAARYVRSHLSETIRLADVSRHVDLSPNYFSRIFASEMGTPFVSYVTAARMDRAKELLRSTNLPVTEIAAEVGVPDHSYFTKLFRTTTGRTPSVFRQGGEGPPVGPPGEMRNV